MLFFFPRYTSAGANEKLTRLITEENLKSNYRLELGSSLESRGIQPDGQVRRLVASHVTCIYNVYFVHQVCNIYKNTTNVFRGLHGAVTVVGARAEAAGHRRVHNPIRQTQGRRESRRRCHRRSSQEDQGTRGGDGGTTVSSFFQWRSSSVGDFGVTGIGGL